MPKLWLILSVLSLIIGLAGFFYQEAVLHAYWCWSQFLTVETAVSVALAVGMTLLVVAVVEYIWRRRS